MQCALGQIWPKYAAHTQNFGTSLSGWIGSTGFWGYRYNVVWGLFFFILLGPGSSCLILNYFCRPFHDVVVWTEVIQDTFLDFFDQEKLRFASATSVRFSPQGFERFYKHWEKYSDKILLRSQLVSNSPEFIRRLGVIAMNTPIEFDIYGHANSTCVAGSR